MSCQDCSCSSVSSEDIDAIKRRIASLQNVLIINTDPSSIKADIKGRAALEALVVAGMSFENDIDFDLVWSDELSCWAVSTSQIAAGFYAWKVANLKAAVANLGDLGFAVRFI